MMTSFEHQSTFRLFLEQLYEFFFRRQKAEFAAYGIALLAALAYAAISDFAFSRPGPLVMYEGFMLGVAVFLSVVISHVYAAAKERKRAYGSENSRQGSAVDLGDMAEVVQLLVESGGKSGLGETPLVGRLADRLEDIENTMKDFQRNQEQILSVLQHASSEFVDVGSYIRHGFAYEVARETGRVQSEQSAKAIDALGSALIGSLENSVEAFRNSFSEVGHQFTREIARIQTDQMTKAVEGMSGALRESLQQYNEELRHGAAELIAGSADRRLDPSWLLILLVSELLEHENQPRREENREGATLRRGTRGEGKPTIPRRFLEFPDKTQSEAVLEEEGGKPPIPRVAA